MGQTIKPSESNKEVPFVNLPKLIKVEILLFLDVQSLGRFFRTCKTLYSLSKEESIWKTITLSKIKTIKEKEKEKEGNWKQIFKNSHLMGFWQDTYTLCQKETEMIQKASKIFHKETFPRNSISSFDDKPNSWTCFLDTEGLNSSLNWITVTNKTEVKHSVASFDVLITKNEETTGFIVIGAVNEPRYSKNATSGNLTNYIGGSSSSIGIFSGYSNLFGGNGSDGVTKIRFAKGDLISLEIDPFKQELKFFHNKKQNGNIIKWKDLSGDWSQNSKFHPAISLCVSGRVGVALRISTLN